MIKLKRSRVAQSATAVGREYDVARTPANDSQPLVRWTDQDLARWMDKAVEANREVEAFRVKHEALMASLRK